MTYTPTLVFDNPDFITKFKSFVESLGAKLVNEKIEEDEFLENFREVIKEIKNGQALENAMSFEEFEKRMSGN
jgi:hypothetical protein